MQFDEVSKQLNEALDQRDSAQAKLKEAVEVLERKEMGWHDDQCEYLGTWPLDISKCDCHVRIALQILARIRG